MFTQEDVGRMLFLDPRPWYLRLWHFIWFKVLRRKRPTHGVYIIEEVVDSTTITVDRGCEAGSGDQLTVV